MNRTFRQISLDLYVESLILNQMSYRRESTMISPWEMFRSQSLLGLGGLLESS